MDEEERRGARVVRALLLGTVAGGVLGSVGEYFLDDYVRHLDLASSGGAGRVPAFVRLALPRNPLAHVGALLGCALAWKFAAAAAGVDAAPGAVPSLAFLSRGAMTALWVGVLTLAGSLLGLVLGPIVGALLGEVIIGGGGDQGSAGFAGFEYGVYGGPPVGALLGCWVALHGRVRLRSADVSQPGAGGPS